MPTLVINQQRVEVDAGTSLLDAARALDIEIPALCHWDGVRPMNSCMLCVVRDVHSGRLVPSCSTLAGEGMEIETESGDVCAARKEVLELLVSEHVGDCEAPCSHICPATLDIPLMMRQIHAGNLDAAAFTVSEGLVFPWTLGYVCPAPCQNGCRRKGCDEVVQIRQMHRNVARKAHADNPELLECPPGTGKRVAVIGGGLTGMASAWVLRKLGHAVTVYEKEEVAGGKLRNLAQEELPRGVLDEEIDWIARLGVHFEYGHEVGDATALDALLAEFDAAIVACKGVAEPAGNIFEAQEHKLAVRAVSNGKSAAQRVDNYLQMKGAAPAKERFASKMARMSDTELENLREHNENWVSMDVPPLRGEWSDSQAEAGRCLHCDCRKRNSCSLRRWATEYGAERRKYKTTQAQDFRIIGGPGKIVFEPGKCIKCGLCIEIARRDGEDLGLAFIGRGFDMKVQVPFNGSLDEGLKKSADECIAACPTAALSFRNQEDIDLCQTTVRNQA